MSKTPEELLIKIWSVLKSFNILWMTTYMECDPSIYNIWMKRKALPYRNVKKIVEYLEAHNDDCVTLCWELMEYYKEQAKAREKRIAEAKERNRLRNKERQAKLRALKKQK